MSLYRVLCTNSSNFHGNPPTPSTPQERQVLVASFSRQGDQTQGYGRTGWEGGREYSIYLSIGNKYYYFSRNTRGNCYK